MVDQARQVDLLIGRLQRAVEEIEGSAQTVRATVKRAADDARGLKQVIGEFETSVSAATEAVRMVAEMRGGIDAACAGLEAKFSDLEERVGAVERAFGQLQQAAETIRNVEGTAMETEANIRAAGEMATNLLRSIDAIQKPIVKLATDIERMSGRLEAGDRFRARAEGGARG